MDSLRRGRRKGKLQGNGLGLCDQQRPDVCPVEDASCRSGHARPTGESGAAAWTALTPGQRAAWEEYAHAWYPAAAAGRATCGMSVFRGACTARAMLGLPAPVAPEPERPPWPLRSVVTESPDAPDEFRFKLTHGLEQLDRYAVSVRITPGTGSLARRPRACEFRAICGVGARSTAPLPPSGGSIAFQRARFAVPEGQRFGFALKVIRLADGATSSEFAGEAVRKLRG